MIVAMDIGNTNIKAAVFEGSRLVKRWRCATDPAMTSDQYGIIMADLFRYHNLNMQAVEGIMISSVVPTINYTIEHMCRDYFHLEPRLLVPGMKTGLNIRYENPRELGSDRIANAVAVSDALRRPGDFYRFRHGDDVWRDLRQIGISRRRYRPRPADDEPRAFDGHGEAAVHRAGAPAAGHRQDDGFQHSGGHFVRIYRFGREDRRAYEARTRRRRISA